MKGAFMQVNPGYTHGWIDCRQCFTDEKDTQSVGDFLLLNNPGYSGSSTPSVLVLGFSKGATQIESARQADFDQVAFAGMRARLQKILTRLDLMPEDRDIDELMTAKEKVFGFTSLVRCSLCKMKGEACLTSGAVVTASFTASHTYRIIQRCAMTFLTHPPESLQQVILLGTNKVYIEKTKHLFVQLFPDFESINPVAFRVRGAIWVYVAHPSKANGCFQAWMDAEAIRPSGKKCRLAIEGLAS
jgi:hypothetical protein